ncbi:MAG TPA: ATP-binding domain-containing protein [Micromonosporaceae bacterium]
MSTASRAAQDQPTDDVSTEQTRLSSLYRRLDDLRERAADRLAAALPEIGGTPQAQSERDSRIQLYSEQLAQLDAVEEGLCFGRLDLDDGARRYIGRIGLFDERDHYQPLLIDWRAPAARPFYLATTVAPDGVRRRRHIRTKLREVVGLDDEVLDLSAASSDGPATLTNEAALLAALTADRTGRMGDIVETIQAEQDRIIRAPLEGVLVVQGGPGTGKTAVALHRAAYLLYTHRELLASRGVLVVGPNATFLRYISQVLPSLAETGVLLATLGDLYPGVAAHHPEPPQAAEVKGRPEMLRVLAAAIEDRQRVPDDDVEIAIDRATVRHDTLRLDRSTCLTARERARRSGRPHNAARQIFETEVIHALAGQLADRIGTDPFAFDPLGGDDAPGDEQVLDEAELAEIRRELRAEPEIAAALNRLWPILTPQELLSDLFASAERLAMAAPQLSRAERDLLLRDPGTGWTPADVPLLDEAHELLGAPVDPVAAARAEREQRQRLEYARGALDIALGSRSIDTEDEVDPEVLSALDVIDAERLAHRHGERAHLTTAQRAAADRAWAFGHIIVDEAQELSPLAWRLLMRRSPSRSMTVVGDLAQLGQLGGASSWVDVFEPYVGGRWRLAELTVSYRTPAEILELATPVLARIDPALTPPRAVRRTGVTPWRLTADRAGLGDRLVDLVRQETDRVGEGRVGVIVPAGRLTELGSAVTAALPEASVGDRPDLESPVVVLTVAQAKGLEFDAVLVIDAQGIVAESPRGDNDLYVALTRATRRLGVLDVL